MVVIGGGLGGLSAAHLACNCFPVPTGECSLCRTKLLSGKVFHPNGVKLRKSDRAFDYIHPCMAYPLEDLKIMI